VDRYQYILGCLLGTALGDSVGLRREGLSHQRAAKMYGGPPLQPNLVFGRGFCSDDTELTQIVGRAVAMSNGDLDGFEQELCRQMKCWLLTGPAGVGWATLRACIKLLIGFRPGRSGVFSAGNGPAMRSALLGVCAETNAQLKDWVRSSSRLTHTDPRAEEGAYVVARAASLTVHGLDNRPFQFLSEIVMEVKGEELRGCLCTAAEALAVGKTPREFADSQGWRDGVSGYVNQTVPAAVYCWARSPNDFRRCVENAVVLGGDTDSVGAITGAICGANLGSDKLPEDWLSRLSEIPRGIDWMQRLAKALAKIPAGNGRVTPPSMHWPATIPRNVLFAAVVLSIGFRRLLPPYVK
jgi:ADP-ribosyl-[dinitrogen reductase] hydrolase